MAILAVYNSQMEKVGEREVRDEVFGLPVRKHVLYEVVKWQLAKRRAGTASTKNRSEVRGGGKKPWRQKGTGRARAGSNTSPLWRRGGTVFGPTPRDYSYTLPKKVRNLALRMALSAKNTDGNLVIVRDFGLEGVKTKDFASFLNRFGVRKAVIVTEAPDRVLCLSSRNIPHITLFAGEGLNVYDILRHTHLIIKESALESIEQRFGS